MDMKEASAMTEASGLTNEEDGNARRLPLQTSSQDAAIRWARAAAQFDGEGPAAVALRRVSAWHLGRAPALGEPESLHISWPGSSRHSRPRSASTISR